MMVSILVPVYNSAPYLQECVQSLTGQTYRDLQIVLINDGSTDDSWTLMKQLAKADNRIEVYSQSNSGVAATRNRLLEKARGEFILFVDSDDWIDLDTVETLMREQKKEDFDIVMFQIGAVAMQDCTCTQEEAVKLFLKHTSFRGSLCDKLIRSDLINGLSIDQTVSYGEDALMVWQVLQRARSVRWLHNQFYHYRVNMNSLSRRSFNGRKFSAYTTWDSICRDTNESWPQYSDIAYARFACEMTQVLRAAALAGYKRDAAVKLLQEEVRRDSGRNGDNLEGV